MTALAFNDRAQKTTPASSTDPQTLDFPIFSDSDIDVYVNGTLTTDWTVASTYVDGVADSAIITIITPVVSSPTVDIVGARDPRRDQFLVAAGAQLVAAINADLARRTAESQELFRDLLLAITIPVGEDLNNVLPKAETRASKYLFFGGDGSVGVTGTAPAVMYQGAFTTANEPTLRLSGSALQAGDLYFNTTDDVFKVYDGANWITAISNLIAASAVTVADSGALFDGSDVEAVLAEIITSPAFTGTIQTLAAVITSTSNAVALTMTGASKKTLALDENTTITVSAEVADQVVELWITQGSSGGTAAWSGVDKWIGGSAPTLSTTAGQIDIIILSSATNGTTIVAQHIGVAS